MSAALKPETITPATTVVPSKTVDIDAMVEAQEKEIRDFFQEVMTSDRQKVLRPRWEMRDFIRRVIDRHVDLLERWGGWRWHSKPFDAMPLANDEIIRIIDAEAKRFSAGAILYAKDKTKAAQKLDPLKMRDWGSEADAIYCTVNGCCLPYPNKNATNLFRNRNYLTANGEKEAEETYASRTVLKIRNEQAASRAVLAEVRRVFKDHPNYVTMWETICENLGVAWASSRGNPVTLSFAPVDFLRCGHYGEGNSCYRTAGGQEHSKYNLSVIPNSVMGLFYKDNDNWEDPMKLRKQKAIARCWGFLDLEHGGALFSNLYMLGWNQVRSSLEAALQQAFGWKVQGGMPTEHALKNFFEYAYTNGDNNIFANKNILRKVQDTLNATVKMTEANRTQRVPCASCATPYGHQSMMIECGCKRHICPECITKTDCCGAKVCKNCAPHKVTCAGCGKVTCGRCTDKNGKNLVCSDTAKSFCTTCVEKLTQCAYCPNKTSTPSVCCVDGKDAACQVCAKEKHRTCDRCNKPVGLSHVTRCGGCKQRRCDNCAVEGEGNDPKSPCKACQEGGVKVKANEPDPEVMKRFKASIDALPAELRDKFLESMRTYKWDMDDALDNDDDEENDEDNED